MKHWLVLFFLALLLGGCAPAGEVALGASLPTLTAPVQDPLPLPGLETPTLPAMRLTSTALPQLSLPSPLPALPTAASTNTPAAGAPTLPAATPTPDHTPPACASAHGQIETGAVPNSALPNPLVYRLYLPPCYDQSLGQRYPVLYLIHGQSYTADQWDRLGADETADELIASGQAPPFIIVLPYDPGGNKGPDEDPFDVAVMQALLPWVDGHYRTLPERQYRAVGGLSRGGGWALRLGLAHWQSFGSLGLHSAAIFWYDTRFIKGWLNAIPADQYPRLYIDIGDQDTPQALSSNTWFEALLTARDIPHEWHLFPGFHEESYWQTHLKQYLLWYTSDW